MSFSACADIVRKADPDRFLATMVAPVEKRGALFAVYAFNVEVSRAPWVSAEPMINDMRLQWWMDAIEEIAAGKPARRHEVVTPLAGVIDAEAAQVLALLIKARHWDVRSEPFKSAEHFQNYLAATGGGLMWVAARVSGAHEGEAAIREFGYCAGLASWFKAVPDLIARGRQPLIDPGEVAVGNLARDGLERLRRARKVLPRSANHAAYAGWQTIGTLRSVVANPAILADGRLHNSEFRRRTSLLWRTVMGRP